MKKLISLLLCISLITLSLVGCNKEQTPEAPKNTASKEFIPSKLNVSALYDSTACSLSYLMELNTQSKLKGTYAVSLYKNDKEFIASDEFMFGLAFTTLSSGVELCKTKDYARMLSLISCSITAFSDKEIKSIKDFSDKKILVYNDSDLLINLNIMLEKASVKCKTIDTRDSYEFIKLLKSGKYDIAVAAYPTAAEIPESEKSFKHSLSLNDEWEKLHLKGIPYSHCIVASSEVISEEFKTCELFFEEFNNSIEKMNSANNSVVQALVNRGINSTSKTAQTTCKQNGFLIEDYTNTEKLLTECAKVRNDNNQALKIDHVKYN